MNHLLSGLISALSVHTDLFYMSHDIFQMYLLLASYFLSEDMNAIYVRLFLNACSEKSQSPDQMFTLLQERGLIFLFPELEVAKELSHLLDTVKIFDDLTIFSSCLKALDGACVTADFVHSLMAACFSLVWRLGVCNCESGCANEENVMEAEKNAWEALAKAGLEICLQNTARQLNTLHALQVFWHELGLVKGEFQV